MIDYFRKNIIMGTTEKTKDYLPELAEELAHKGMEEFKKCVLESFEGSKK